MRFYPTSGGNNVDLDVITTGAGDIVKGKVGVDNDGEPLVGTLALSGNATEAYVYNGKTFYSTDPKTKKTGKMTVNSLLSFKVSPSSGRRVLASWGNPKQASGKPYSGVYIRYSTSGYPGKTGGTQIAKGAGSNTASGGTSTTYLDLPNLNTKYYLSIYPYVTCSAGEMTGDVLNTTVTTSKEQIVTCTSSKTVKVPAGYKTCDLFAVGGGGCGSYGDSSSAGGSSECDGGGGGAGGYTATKKNIAATEGESLAVIVGAGGRYTAPPGAGDGGGESSVTRSGVKLVSAAGGDAYSGTSHWGRDGGSGGGGGGWGDRDYDQTGGDGGSDGGDGKGYSVGTGQGKTTRAWGASSGTLYAGGGGGGGGVNMGSYGQGGAGGAGGGGKGEHGQFTNDYIPVGANGSANTGGGGGGGGGHRYGAQAHGGNGGSGIVLIRFY